MRKVKIKKVKVALGAKSEELASMFNQMIGTGTVNIPIAYPRYKRIRMICEQLVKLFRLLRDSPFMQTYTEFQSQADELDGFCKYANEKIIEMFSIDLSDVEYDYSLLSKEREAQFSEIYENMKKSDLLKTFIILCDRLVPFKKNFVDLDKLNYKFITAMAGTEWAPFPFTTLNIKYIFTLPRVGENTISFFMAILHKSYILSKQLYDELQTPDIDIDQLSEIIMNNIDEIQKRPELNRCGEAFRKIKESVGLLKSRLNGYYRDFIATNDSTIIMQHFIIDVSSETKASPTVIRQFGVIAEYYRNIAKSQVKDPKIRILLDKIDESFKDLERGTSNLVNINEDEPEVVEEAAPAVPIVSPAALSADALRNLTGTNE